MWKSCVQSVNGCQLVTKHLPLPHVKPTPMPQQPWEDLALDISQAAQT